MIARSKMIKMNKTLAIFGIFFILVACQTPKKQIDVQGHRGCRGLLPENTIPAFIEALHIGVTTLEMDVVISKDSLVVVSHEPFFSYHISTLPNGDLIREENEKKHNLYLLNYADIKKYDVGLRTHPNFTKQEKIAVVKPLLSQVIDTAESYVNQHQLKKPYYNIEIKRKPENDSKFHPPLHTFVDLVLAQVKTSGISPRVCIQSFDIATLQRVHQLAPELTTCLLIENEKPFQENVDLLGFTPNIYSPYYKLLTPEIMKSCAQRNILVIPWTVNTTQDMRQMLELNVDGIITDYPDQLKNLLIEMNIPIK